MASKRESPLMEKMIQDLNESATALVHIKQDLGKPLAAESERSRLYRKRRTRQRSDDQDSSRRSGSWWRFHCAGFDRDAQLGDQVAWRLERQGLVAQKEFGCLARRTAFDGGACGVSDGAVDSRKRSCQASVEKSLPRLPTSLRTLALRICGGRCAFAGMTARWMPRRSSK
jgi:hypothetical protein